MAADENQTTGESEAARPDLPDLHFSGQQIRGWLLPPLIEKLERASTAFYEAVHKRSQLAVLSDTLAVDREIRRATEEYVWTMSHLLSVLPPGPATVVRIDYSSPWSMRDPKGNYAATPTPDERSS